MPRTPLTEPEAWRQIAANIAQRGLVGSGLRAEIVWLDQHAPTAPDVFHHMISRLRDHLLEWHVDRDDAFEANEAPVRILAALFLAHEADDE